MQLLSIPFGFMWTSGVMKPMNSMQRFHNKYMPKFLLQKEELDRDMPTAVHDALTLMYLRDVVDATKH